MISRSTRRAAQAVIALACGIGVAPSMHAQTSPTDTNTAETPRPESQNPSAGAVPMEEDNLLSQEALDQGRPPEDGSVDQIPVASDEAGSEPLACPPCVCECACSAPSVVPAPPVSALPTPSAESPLGGQPGVAAGTDDQPGQLPSMRSFEELTPPPTATPAPYSSPD